MSFGGSGNTFIRALIEYVTKIHTGSVYKREFLKLGFVDGKSNCGTQTIAIKVHASHLSPTSFFGSRCGLCLCKEPPGNLTHIPKPAIFVTRNPWDAFYALYQYWYGQKTSQGRHKSHINLNGWDSMQFTNVLKNQYVDDYIKSIQTFHAWQKTNGKHPLLLIKYENIVNKDMNIKTDELLKIIKFLYHDEYYKENELLFKQRIHCVWNISLTDERLIAMHRDPPNAEQLNKTYAYQTQSDIFLDMIWDKIKPFAELFGYTSYKKKGVT